MSTKQNIVIEAGATFHNDFALLDSDNNPLNVQALTGKAQMRPNAESNTFFNFSVTLTTGNLSLDMAANNTVLIPAGQYLFDIFITSPTEVAKVVYGIATVIGEITQS